MWFYMDYLDWRTEKSGASSDILRNVVLMLKIVMGWGVRGDKEVSAMKSNPQPAQFE